MEPHLPGCAMHPRTRHIRVRTCVAIGLATNRVSTIHKHVSSLWYSDNWRSNKPKWRSNNPQNGRNIQENTIPKLMNWNQHGWRKKIEIHFSIQCLKAFTTVSVKCFLIVSHTLGLATRPTQLFQLVLFLCFSHIGGGHPTNKIVPVSAFFMFLTHWRWPPDRQNCII